MIEAMKASSHKISCMGLEFLNLQMGNIMKVSTIMIKSMVMEYFIGQTVKDIKDGGMKENNTDMEY
jgi:hypothetical protein